MSNTSPRLLQVPESDPQDGCGIAFQALVCLLLGEYDVAHNLLQTLENLSAQDISSALDCRDADGNNLLHRTVMATDGLTGRATKAISFGDAEEMAS
jgi:hypothetical protein